MTRAQSARNIDRREFLRAAAITAGAAVTASTGACAAAGAAASGPSLSQWAARPGIQIYTVRDRLEADYEGTLARLAELGYRNLELFGSLGTRTPRDLRAMLDRHGLSAPSTHISVRADQDPRSTLEGYAVIGHRYTSVVGATGGGGASATVESIRRQAELLNRVGQAGREFGIKALLHNHVNEFVPFTENPSLRPYDIYLSETDPALVTMELDIGWATVAGASALEMFRRNPGRYELWHVKDMDELATVTALTQTERQRAAKIVPIGEGDIAYRPIFEAAQTAGLKHYFVEQDTAASWSGGSLAAAELGLRNLRRQLG
jgi:sugar phosphate isomerase/epimerase